MRKEVFLDKLKIKRPAQFGFYNYDLVPDKFKTLDKIEISCPLHGIFTQIADVHLSGHGCSDCGGVGRLNTESFINKAVLVHGSKYCYDLSLYTGNKNKLTIRCPTHGVFEQTPNTHLTGSGCAQCFNETKRDNTESFICKAQIVHGETYDYSDTLYIHSKEKVGIRCKTHGYFEQLAYSHLKGNGCPLCRQSKGEEFIDTLLKELGVVFKREHKLTGTLYRYDFFLPELNILIEYHGVQHHEAVEWFGGQKGYEENVKRDECKVALAREGGYSLIVLNYRQFNSKALKQALFRDLKNIYRHWVLINGELKVFKWTGDLATYFNIESTPLDRILIERIQEIYPDITFMI